MHIADLTMFFAAEGGGVRRYLEAKREWLRNDPAYRHTLVVPEGAAPPGEGRVLVPGLPLPFSHGYRLPVSKHPAVRALTRLKPDIIEAGDPYRLAWAALDAGQALGVPVLAFYHSDLPRALGRLCGRHAERLATAYARRLYRAFDMVLAPSAAMVARLAELGIYRVCQQPLGVDTTTFRPGRRSEEWRRVLGAGPGDRLLLYVGRFAAEKNLPVLIDAVDRLGPGHLLVLVGQGARPAARSNVRVLPYLGDRQRLAALMASCDVFLHAGDQETFGLAVLEAMACGLPVVAARAGGLAELVDDSVGASVLPGDPASLAAAVRRILDRAPRERVQLCAAVRRRARRYDWACVLPPMIARYHAMSAIAHAASGHAPGPSARPSSSSVDLHS